MIKDREVGTLADAASKYAVEVLIVWTTLPGKAAGAADSSRGRLFSGRSAEKCHGDGLVGI